MTVETIELAPGGPRCSRLALGFWRLAAREPAARDTLQLIEATLELGITTFDHADIYGDYRCEELFGAALALSPGVRDRMQLVTKCGIKLVSPSRPAHTVKHYDTSREHIVASVDNSLAKLGTNRIDLLLIHRPDALMDADATAAAFVELKAAGKVLHFGVSNFLPHQFDLLASRLPFPLVTNQIEFSVAATQALEDGTLDQCQRLRISPMAWSPFAGGKLFQDSAPRMVSVRRQLAAVGGQLGGAALDQTALAWILTHPSRPVPVIGSGKIDRVRSAAEACSLRLSREQWFSVWEAWHGRPVP